MRKSKKYIYQRRISKPDIDYRTITTRPK